MLQTVGLECVNVTCKRGYSLDEITAIKLCYAIEGFVSEKALHEPTWYQLVILSSAVLPAITKYSNYRWIHHKGIFIWMPLCPQKNLRTKYYAVSTLPGKSYRSMSVLQTFMTATANPYAHPVSGLGQGNLRVCWLNASVHADMATQIVPVNAG